MATVEGFDSGAVARYVTACASDSWHYGGPTNSAAYSAAAASTSACGSALPTSSDARMTMRHAMKRGASPGRTLTNLDRGLLREAPRRAGAGDGVVEALLDRNLQWGPQLERNRLLEAVAEAALALQQGERDGGRRLDVALGRLHRAPNPGRGWLTPEAVRLVREALEGVLDGLARRPPVVGTLAAGRVRDALAVLPPGAPGA